ncbi:MAG: response regulator [Kiritimatiellia bacterium]|nr:response regulator [Kiritimatiellia bacterium]
MTEERSRPVVLLADDDPFILSLYRDKLVRAGYEVESVSDGEEALRWLQRKAPALLLLDLNMPRVNGVEVLRFVRERSSTPELPVIVLSNACTQEMILEVNRLRPSRFLVKRETAPTRVVEAIREVLDRKGSGDPSSGTVATPVIGLEVPAEDPVLMMREIESAPTRETRQEVWIRFYRLIQDSLRELKAAHPLSLSHQFGKALEHFFDDLYVSAQPPHDRTMRSLREAIRLLPDVVSAGKQADAARPARLLLASSEPSFLARFREAVNRPGFESVAVQSDDSVSDLVANNPFDLLLWDLRRASVVEKGIRRVRGLAFGGTLPMVFVLPDDVAQKLGRDVEDAQTHILVYSAPASEWILRLYATLARARL